MTSVFDLMAPHMAALGFTLLHFCWQALIIAGVYKLADLALPRLSTQLRYLLSLSALIAMFAAGLVTFAYEEWRLAGIAPTALVVTLSPEISAEMTRGFDVSQLIPLLDIAWLMGVVALSLRTLGGLWFVTRLKASAQVVPEALARRFAATVRRLDLIGKVSLRLHPAIDGPFVVGAFRSIIYLPVSALTALSPEQLDAVLSHELEHIRRADYAWNLVQSVIETLFFYHPAVWWLGSRLRDQRELCCDDAALKTCRDPLTYATALLSLEEQRRHVPAGLVMALNGQGSGKTLLSRIARVLGENVTMPRTKRPNAVWALPVVLLTVMAMVPVVQVAVAQPSDIKPPVGNMETAPAADAATASEAETPEVAATEMNDEEAAKVSAGELSQYSGPNIDPDAVAACARAQALRAKADLAKAKQARIDVEAIVAQVRAGAMQAKAEMQKHGMSGENINVEAMVAQARADAERAQVQMKADMARAAATEIDADKIAAEARQAAVQAMADYKAHKDEYKAYRYIRIIPPVAPVAPVAPTPPVAPEAPPAPPAPPVPAAMATPAPLAAIPAEIELTYGKIKAPKPAKAPKAKIELVTPVAYNGWVVKLNPLKGKIIEGKLAALSPSASTLSRLPNASPMAIPAPDPQTDVVVHVNRNVNTNVRVVVK